ncbi:hypothetical protein DFH09DRAFT_1085888 [Mycena vulgaris]|nr:hypothetical protein DFH09DRAFT_1085888 [Mycena vulgaris]
MINFKRMRAYEIVDNAKPTVKVSEVLIQEGEGDRGAVPRALVLMQIKHWVRRGQGRQLCTGASANGSRLRAEHREDDPIRRQSALSADIECRARFFSQSTVKRGSPYVIGSDEADAFPGSWQPRRSTSTPLGNEHAVGVGR